MAGRWSAKRKKLRSGDFSSIYRVSKNGFRLHSSIPFTIYDFNSDLEGCYKEGLYENLNGKAYGSENALQKEEILDIGHPVY